MSKALDEDKLIAKFADKVDKYGRNASFYVVDDEESPYTKKVFFARAEDDMESASTDQIDRKVAYLINSGLTFSPYRTQKIVDSKDSKAWRVVKVEPIESGEQVAAFKIRLGA